MSNVADLVSAHFERKKKLDHNGAGYEQLHRNHDGKRDQPDLPVWKHDSRGDQNAEDRAGSADRGNAERIPGSARVEHYVDEDGDYTGACPGQQVILIKAARSPGPLQIHPEEIQEEHVEKKMHDSFMQEEVGPKLPDKKAPRDVPGNQAKNVIECS